MADVFDDLKRITDQAWRFGKRLSKDDPLGPHDVADRLDKAAFRVWNIIVAAEQAGPEFTAEVLRSRYFTNALPELRDAIDRFLAIIPDEPRAVRVVDVSPSAEAAPPST